MYGAYCSAQNAYEPVSTSSAKQRTVANKLTVLISTVAGSHVLPIGFSTKNCQHNSNAVGSKNEVLARAGCIAVYNCGRTEAATSSHCVENY